MTRVRRWGKAPVSERRCPCGAPRDRVLFCAECHAASKRLTATHTAAAKRARKLRVAMRALTAGELAAVLELTVRDVFLRFVGREETTRDDIDRVVSAMRSLEKRRAA